MSYLIQTLKQDYKTITSSVECDPPEPCTEKLWIAKAMQEALALWKSPTFTDKFVRVMNGDRLIWRTY
jgi:hypothetical protein